MFVLVIKLYCSGVLCFPAKEYLVEKCAPASYQLFQAEAILAQSGEYDGSQRIDVHCEEARTK